MAGVCTCVYERECVLYQADGIELLQRVAVVGMCCSVLQCAGMYESQCVASCCHGECLHVCACVCESVCMCVRVCV